MISVGRNAVGFAEDADQMTFADKTLVRDFAQRQGTVIIVIQEHFDSLGGVALERA